MPTPRLSIRELTPEETIAFLDAQFVGRLAYTFRDRVDIVPVHYVHDDGWLYGRTSFGPKLVVLEHHHWVAFEVDHVGDPWHWTSVVVRGTFHPLDPDGPESEREAHAHAVEVLRGRFPGTLTDDDPVPHRRVLFRIHVDEATGRAAALQHD